MDPYPLLMMDSAPSRWEETKRRLAVVRRYVAIERPTHDDLRASADELGLGIRHMHNLASAFRQKMAADPRTPGVMRDAPRNREAGILVKEVIDLLGRAARTRDIEEAVNRRCLEIGVRPPSRSMVRRAHLRSQRAAPAQRLEMAVDLILDCCVLGIDVEGVRGVRSACLLALVDGAEGRIPVHRLIAGQPEAADVGSLLREYSTLGNVGKATVACASSLVTIADGASGSFYRAGLLLRDVSPRRIAPGAALQAALGERLGKIPLTPRRRTTGGRGVPAPMSMAFVQPIVAALVDRHNGALPDEI